MAASAVWRSTATHVDGQAPIAAEQGGRGYLIPRPLTWSWYTNRVSLIVAWLIVGGVGQSVAGWLTVTIGQVALAMTASATEPTGTSPNVRRR